MPELNVNKISSYLNSEKLVVSFCFLFYVVLSLWIVEDFPNNWDENNNRTFGILASRAINRYLKTRQPLPHKYASIIIHGTAFEYPLHLIEKALKLDAKTQIKQIHLMRHIATKLLFIASVFCFYWMCSLYFQNWRLGLLGAFFLVLHPRIFQHAFHNSSDIGFLAACNFATFGMFQFFRKRSIWWGIFLGGACAFATGIRPVGVLFFGMTLCWFFIWFYKKTETINKKKLLLLLGAYLFSFCLFLLAFWPYLWGAPFSNFFYALLNTVQLNNFDILNLYNSEFVYASDIKWHYNFVWILITTPVVALLFFGIGLVKYSFSWRKAPLTKLFSDYIGLCILGLLVISLLAPIILKSMLFCGWRHHYFIYPAMIFFILVGVRFCFEFFKEKKKIQVGVFVILMLSFSHNLLTMYQLHPYQNLYFNIISYAFGKPKGPIRPFNTDYWGMTSREGLEFLVKHEPGIIKIFPHEPLPLQMMWLDPKDQQRFQFVPKEKAEYFIGMFLFQQGPYPPEIYGKEIYAKKIGSLQVLTVTKKKPGDYPDYYRDRTKK